VENGNSEPQALVSIIIPVRNGELFISDAIASCLDQRTSIAFEILVVNDSSTDGTIEILQKFSNRDSRVKILQNDGVGVGNALQTGLLYSNAEFIVRLDADDRMLPDRVEKQVRALVSDNKLVLCGTQIRLFGDGEVNFSPNSYPLSHADICRSMQFGNAFAHPSVAFKRSSALKVGGYCGKIDGAEDYHLWLRLSKVGELVNLDEVLTEYRIHQNQFTKSKTLRVVLQTTKVQLLWFLGITQIHVRVRVGLFMPLNVGVRRLRIPFYAGKTLAHSLVAWIRT
jgi:glycosyltransferase involved in cell wall biosynthesis